MWKRVAITTVDVPAEDLWEVAADVRRWPEWDPAIEAVSQADEVRPGGVFVVQARGGRQLRIEVEECSPPRHFAYVTRLPLARLRVMYEFEPVGAGTRFRVAVQLSGPLTPLWRRLLGEAQASVISEKARRLVHHARLACHHFMSAEPGDRFVAIPPAPFTTLERDLSPVALEPTVDGVVALVAGVLLAGAAVGYLARGWLTSAPPRRGAEQSASAAAKVTIRRVGARLLIVPEGVAREIGLRTAEASAQTRPVALPPLHGRLGLDPASLVLIRPRFPGEVLAVGPTSETRGTGAALGLPRMPPIGGKVRRGEVLAVVWSRGLGERANDLLSALSRLRSDEGALRRLEEANRTGEVAEGPVSEMRRAVEAGRAAAGRAERALRSWQVSEEEIAALRAEAERPGGPDRRRGAPTEWARVEVRAPRDGVILEQNLLVGDAVDVSTVLFRVADLSRLALRVEVHEGYLPLLQSLPSPIPAKVSVAARQSSALVGTLNQVGTADRGHSAWATGFVENPGGNLKAGQAVTVFVELPPRPGEVELPAAAVVDDGGESIVFVEAVTGGDRFARRRVRVVRRLGEVAHVADDAAGVRPGERVVTSGALHLLEALARPPAPRGERKHHKVGTEGGAAGAVRLGDSRSGSQ
jgi:cobalt-zinc-cadmium efflux system membrane fusion protein